jgi:hypothetical protein
VTTFLQIIILLSVAAVAILVVYLIDRVNNLQRLTRLMQPDSAAMNNPPEANGPFGDLSGQRLWEALAGVPTEGWDETAIELVRNRYALVLRKHVEDLFYEGLMHARGGTQQVPSASRPVRTLRGVVESWIPIEHAMTLYKAGWDKQSARPETLASLRKSLDAAVEGLFNAVSIKLPRPMSEHLIPMDPAETATSQEPTSQDAAPSVQSLPGSSPALGLTMGNGQSASQTTGAGGENHSVSNPAPALTLTGSGASSPSMPDLVARPSPPEPASPGMAPGSAGKAKTG